MSSLIVEERLRVVRVSIEALQRIAALAQEDGVEIPMLESPQAFAAWTGQMCEEILGHLQAVRAGLPFEALEAPAPFTRTKRRMLVR